MPFHGGNRGLTARRAEASNLRTTRRRPGRLRPPAGLQLAFGPDRRHRASPRRGPGGGGHSEAAETPRTQPARRTRGAAPAAAALRRPLAPRRQLARGAGEAAPARPEGRLQTCGLQPTAPPVRPASVRAGGGTTLLEASYPGEVSRPASSGPGAGELPLKPARCSLRRPAAMAAQPWPLHTARLLAPIAQALCDKGPSAGWSDPGEGTGQITWLPPAPSCLPQTSLCLYRLKAGGVKGPSYHVGHQ